jgi:D-3-phosphoglycerate dehydrogenase / 2-oxoglutarate reductase
MVAMLILWRSAVELRTNRATAELCGPGANHANKDASQLTLRNLMKKVLIPTKLDAVAAETLRANGRYEVVQASVPLATLAAEHADAFALIVRSEAVTQAEIDLFPQIRIIVRAGAGYNNIDTRYARKKGIDVMNTPGANANAVAEEVLALMLADARHVIAADGSTRAGHWEKQRFMGCEIAGKTVGIVGLGNIGQLVARRLKGFETRLLGCDPFLTQERAQKIGVRLTDLETLFTEADYVTLHIPETAETRGLIGPALLDRMKDGATLVNCARAGIVQEDALRSCKAKKKLRFLNDVYERDAEGEKSVRDIADIMLPHLGASTREANRKAARAAAEELIDLDQKGVTSFVVNRDIPEGLDEAYCRLAHSLGRLCRCLGGRQLAPRELETTFYGSLEPFSDWLLVPIVAGISDDFDSSTNYREARAHLEEMGIEYTNRVGSSEKGFENSITVDLISEVDSETLRRTSIRGTVTEGLVMVSRINEFNKLYFEPVGPMVFFLYRDRPGVIGAIGRALAQHDINIEDMRNPHDPATNRSLAILRVNREPPAALMTEIADEIEAVAAFSIQV